MAVGSSTFESLTLCCVEPKPEPTATGGLIDTKACSQ